MAFINQPHLAGLWAMMPGVRNVNLYSRQAGSTLSSAISAKAEKRPIDSNERKLSDIAVDVDACTFHVWPSTFSDASYVCQPSDIIEEANGNRWEVVSTRLEMMETRTKLTCVQVFT